MKKTSISVIFLAVLFCLTLALPLPYQNAAAYSRVNTNREVSLALRYQSGGVNLPDVDVKIYRVADISDAAAYTLTDALKAQDGFAHLAPFSDMKTNGDWAAMASTMAAYLAADSVAATQTGATGTGGNVSFSNLKTGLYLIAAGSTRYSGSTYTFAPFLLSLPDIDQNTGDWNYAVTAVPKSEQHTPGGEKDQNYKVVKHWADSGNEQKRPRSITVELLKNGAFYGRQTLSEANNWTYAWSAADDGSTWQVVERNIPDSYRVTLTGGSAAFILKNAYTSNVPDEPTPLVPTDNVPQNPTPGGKLPQTGQLWWPVPLMAGAGTVLYGIGWAVARRGKKKHE